MTRQMGERRTSTTKLLAVVLLIAVVYATGGDISANRAGLSEEQGPFFAIIVFEGEVWVTRKGCDAPVEAFIGMQLAPGDHVQTGFLGSAELKGDRGETILLESNTSLEIGANADLPGRGRSVRLTVGSIWVKVVKLTQAFGNMFRFTITTPTAFAGVRGTTFYVSVDDDSITEISVFDGIVEVIAADTNVEVPAGYVTKVRPGREPEAPKEHGEDQNRAWERRRQWFEQKPGKLPPPFQEDWQPPGLVDKDQYPDKPGKSEENPPFNNGPKGKDKPGLQPKKGKGPPAKNAPPQARGLEGDGKDG
ncbi:MAG: FecR domain-containing protein [Firmicutes bacterium]|nr:FecR domain-containing protein [Bacillota bacterium]